MSWAAVTTLFVEIIGLHGLTAKLTAAAMILVLGAVNRIGNRLRLLRQGHEIGKLAAIFTFVGMASSR
ncbi:MAG: hypothetical protein R3B70_18615 [Polyangiaceae bacterium]